MQMSNIFSLTVLLGDWVVFDRRSSPGSQSMIKSFSKRKRIGNETPLSIRYVICSFDPFNYLDLLRYIQFVSD